MGYSSDLSLQGREQCPINRSNPILGPTPLWPNQCSWSLPHRALSLDSYKYYNYWYYKYFSYIASNVISILDGLLSKSGTLTFSNLLPSLSLPFQVACNIITEVFSTKGLVIKRIKQQTHDNKIVMSVVQNLCVN